MSPLSSLPLVLLSVSTILLSFPFNIDALSAQTCPSYPRCGNVDIFYPFWFIDPSNTTTTTSYCGYPGFGLSCTDPHSNLSIPHTPILHLPNDNDHYVTHINYNLATLTLVNVDFYGVVPCPQPRHNLTLDDAHLFSFTKNDKNLTFFLHCSRAPQFFGGFEPAILSCIQNGRTYATQNDLSVLGSSWRHVCKDSIALQVSKRVDQSELPQKFGNLLSTGFELQWKTPPVCARCEGSGGVCLHVNGSFSGCLCDNGEFRFHNCMNTGSTSKSFSFGEQKSSMRPPTHVELIISQCQDTKKRRIMWKIAIGIAVFVVLLVAVFLITCKFKNSFVYSICSMNLKKDDSIDVEKFIKDYHSMVLTKFSYTDIKRMTNGFEEKLGQGGFGIVYKGKLPNGEIIAAKILENLKDNGQDFINEVATIGRIHHFNIIRLIGYCCQGSRRALLYEYMPNGSLADLIFNEELRPRLRRQKLLEIAIGIANGVQYMHNGCDTRILHLDIKPQNVLLDLEYHPKISDFGLAKLYSRKDSVVSLTGARGTVGYIAPEVFMRRVGGVSHKSDVYSYGMLLLDMIVGRENVEAENDRSSALYFPNWIYSQLDQWREMELDSSVVEEVKLQIARKMVLVGLWCVQINPSDRPSISRVLEMLEGSHESIEIPPKPFYPSSPGRQLLEA